RGHVTDGVECPARPQRLVQILEILEKAYGPQQLAGPTDAYEMIVFLNCGYPASDGACAKGFDALKREVGVQPNKLLAVSRAKLAKLMRPSVIVPAACAERLKDIAGTVKNEFDEDLTAALEKRIAEVISRKAGTSGDDQKGAQSRGSCAASLTWP